MRVGPMKPIDVVPRRLEVGRFDGDEAGEAIWPQRGDLQRDAPAHRATNEHRPIQLESIAKRDDRIDVGFGRQKVFLRLEALGRQRFAVPGQIERDEAMGIGEIRIVEDEPPLPAVRAGSVQAYDGTSSPTLLEIEALRCSTDVEN